VKSGFSLTIQTTAIEQYVEAIVRFLKYPKGKKKKEIHI